MKNWIDYLINEESKCVIQSDHGLIAFNISGKELYVTDFYIEKKHRGTGAGLDLARKIETLAKEEDCTSMTCNIFINKNNRGEFANKVRLFSNFGFLPSHSNNNVLTMIKEL